MLDYFVAYPTDFFMYCGIVGVVVGSFLNVVIYRLPKIMQKEWEKQCYEYLQLPQAENPNALQLSLSFPRSHCPSCATSLRWYENIPLISFILQAGKCRHCKANINWRYLFVELLTALITLALGQHFGATLAFVGGCMLAWSLIVLTFIDLDHQLLPDSITQPLLWLGLFFNLFSTYVVINDAVIGAMLGYMILWSVYWLFKLLTDKEGMGFGDFKLLALLGAWLGWSQLPLIIVASSLIGSIIGITYLAIQGRSHLTPIPFGPFLSLAGLIALFFGETLNIQYLNWISGG